MSRNDLYAIFENAVEMNMCKECGQGLTLTASNVICADCKTKHINRSITRPVGEGDIEP